MGRGYCRFEPPLKMAFVGAAHPPQPPLKIGAFSGAAGGASPLKIVFKILPKIHLIQIELQNTSKECKIFTISM